MTDGKCMGKCVEVTETPYYCTSISTTGSIVRSFFLPPKQTVCAAAQPVESSTVQDRHQKLYISWPWLDLYLGAFLAENGHFV
eukprot:COSAG05_NODE_1566_length_4539_cov_2.142342_2_plen_83_part_00